jgi:chromosomal replication initiator protein
MKTIWEEIKTAIKLRVPSHSFRMWIEPLRFGKNDDGSIFLSFPNFFSKKRVLDQYGDIIESELRKATGKSCRFIVKVSDSKDSSGKKLDENPQLPLPQMNVHPQNGRFLRKDFTFDQFVVGGNNDFAYSAALSLASRKNSLQNSLFLLSKTGMGKSHLSQAVGHHILSEHPRDRVYYTTVENFSNEMVSAYRNHSIDAFKGKYRNQCDVLLLEDVHYLTGKERTQIELALTLDTLFESNKKIIFSSCYLPSDIPKLNDELRSRLSCALISNIEPPEFRTRVRILQKKAKHNGCKIPEDVLHYLASELAEDVRQLESGLIGVTAKSSLLGTPINLKLAESVVKNIVCRRKNITIEVIKKLVCKHYRISVKEIVSSSRKQLIVRPRQIAIFLSRRYTDAPLQAIGKSFNRYHATALYSIGAVERELKENGAMQKQVEFLCQKLETGKF